MKRSRRRGRVGSGSESRGVEVRDRESGKRGEEEVERGRKGGRRGEEEGQRRVDSTQKYEKQNWS